MDGSGGTGPFIAVAIVSAVVGGWLANELIWSGPAKRDFQLALQQAAIGFEGRLREVEKSCCPRAIEASIRARLAADQARNELKLAQERAADLLERFRACRSASASGTSEALLPHAPL